MCLNGDYVIPYTFIKNMILLNPLRVYFVYYLIVWSYVIDLYT